MEIRKKHLIISLWLIIFILSFRGVTADGSGTCGTNVKYTVSGNTISFAKGDGTEDPVWGGGCGDIFKDDSNITSVTVSEKISVTNGNGLFRDFIYVQEMDLENLDVSAVTDMGWMFTDCSSLTSLDVSSWDTANVTDMKSMFYNCSSLTSLDVSGWNTANVKYVMHMFDLCSSLTALDVSGWNMSNVTDMTNMFTDCSSLTALDVSGWDTSRVSFMSLMFSNCDSLQTLALGEKTLNNPLFDVHFPGYAGYGSTWYYIAPAAASSGNTGTALSGSELFGSYDAGTMAGSGLWIRTWSSQRA